MTVSILMLRALVGAVEPLVGDRGRWLAAADFDPRRLDDCGARVSYAVYEGVRRVALRASGDEALGLHIADPASQVSFDVLAHLTSHAATLRESLEAVARYAPIYSDGAGLSLSEAGDTALLRLEVPRTSSATLRMSAELAMTGMLHLTRRFVGPDARPKRVSFPYAAPSYRAEYARIFAGAERFDQAFVGMELNRAWLSCTQLYQNPELFQTLKQQAERELGRVTREAGVGVRVSQYLSAADPARLPSMDDVAAHFGLSARSLRRRLSDEGYTYKALTDQALVTRAKRLLEGPDGSIQGVAYTMGFASSAAFHRAFKRWTGLTPGQYMASY